MFLVNSNRAALLVVLAFVAAGCVHTVEYSTPARIAFDQSKVLGPPLRNKMQKARKAIRSNPNDPAPHYFLANAYLLQNNLDAAEAEFKTVLSISPGSSNAYYELALINIRRNSYNAALEQLKQAVEISPRFASAHYSLGRLYEKLGNLTQAAVHHQIYLDLSKE